GPAELPDRRLDLVEDEARLGRRVPGPDDLTVGPRRGRPGDEDPITDPDGARVSGDGLPGRPAVDRGADRGTGGGPAHTVLRTVPRSSARPRRRAVSRRASP